MFHRIREALNSQPGPVRPRQGRRLRREQDQDGTTFTITGVGRPGFFLLFGLFFGGFPFLMMLGFLFGNTSGSEGLFGSLFMLPFVFVGTVCFALGLFLWFGKTTLRIQPNTVTVQRLLFDRAWQSRSYQRDELGLSFQESHRTNNLPSYKLVLTDGRPRHGIGVGGSLHEAELLWLEREVRLDLGQEAPQHRGVPQAIRQSGISEIKQASEIPAYRSKTLHILKTPHGWEATLRSGLAAPLIAMIVGTVFFLVGLFVIEGTREALRESIPGLADQSQQTDQPPDWFGGLFAALGLMTALLGLFLLGHRFTIVQRHSRLHLTRRWLFLSWTEIKATDELAKLVLKESGHDNHLPYYSLRVTWKDGRKSKLTYYSSGPDTGQLYARLRPFLPSATQPKG